MPRSKKMHHLHHHHSTPSTEETAGVHHSAASSSEDHHHQQQPSHMEHAAHAEHSVAMFARPFWISLLLTIPIVVYAELFESLLHYRAPVFPGSLWLAPVLA